MNTTTMDLKRLEYQEERGRGNNTTTTMDIQIGLPTMDLKILDSQQDRGRGRTTLR